MTRVQSVLTTLAATLLLAAPASAATLTNADGTLTYAGGDTANDVTFTETAPNEVQVVRDTGADADPIAASGCTENTAGADYTCGGVNEVVANGNGGDDTLDASALTDLPITVDGGEGADILDGGDVVDLVNGDAGADGIDGNGGNDRLNGGDGMDDLEGMAGDDELDGGADGDFVDGGAQNDFVNGGGGGDRMAGDAGNDLINGGEGDDVISAGDGDDFVSADGGDDTILGDAGNDDLGGGEGYDTAVAPPNTPPRDHVVSLDDSANDRLSGDAAETDSVRGDVEAVETELAGFFTPVPPSGNDTLIGSFTANHLAGYSGNDTIEGDLGNDVLSGGDGDDTIRARDGYADFVFCGAGADTAEIDTLDRAEGCETVNSLNVGNVNEDRPPAIEITGPAAGALLRTTAPTTMTASATDDRSIAQVLFLDDDRIVCADDRPPYACDYRPRGEDVGRNTLVAVAVDTSQQTASVTRTFRVDRFSSTITGRVTPARDTRAPFRFVTTGRLRFPAAVPTRLGCDDGVVSVQVKAGGRTISTRRARVRQDCRFASVVTFASRRRFGRSGALRFTLRFTGNEVLKRSLAVGRNIRTRR